MKQLIIAALLCAPHIANAEAWFIPNKNNGQIVITDTECYFKGKTYKNLKSSYARTSGGETIHGCWYYADNFVHVIYEDNTSYTYPLTGFEKLETF